MTDTDILIQDLRRENEALRAELEWKNKVIELAQRNEIRWISIEDKLPMSHDEYIVCCDDANEDSDMQIWGRSGVVVVADYYDGVWLWDSNGTEYSLDGIVTHWMPLPEPPKED